MATQFDPHVALREIRRTSADGSAEEPARDAVAVEEPLEIRVDGEPLAVTMRTPGEDEELAVGFLAGEGLVSGRDDVVSVGLTHDLAAGVVEVRTRMGLKRDPSAERRFYLSSSCGVCGKAALEFVSQEAPPSAPGEPATPQAVLDMPGVARDRQAAFDRTGGIHATALFEPSGRLLVLREDVGRHNAMDKLIGGAWLEGELPLSSRIALLSGRLSFELVQKAARAGIPVLAGVSAPSSLAADLAQEAGITLVGFVRGRRFNVYTHGRRVGAAACVPAPVGSP